MTNILAVHPDAAQLAALIEKYQHLMPKSGAREYATPSDAPRQRPAVHIQTTRDDVLKTEYRQGCLIEHLTNGDIRVNGLLIERPDGWPSPWTRWTMRDAHGNLVVGSTEPGVPAMLVLRDPTREEADRRIGQRTKELQDAGMEVHEALRMALEQLPIEAKVYVGV